MTDTGDKKMAGQVDASSAATVAKSETAEPASPCISVCALDENDVCLGCYRTAGEITDWFMADAAEKRAILTRAEARRTNAMGVRLL